MRKHLNRQPSSPDEENPYWISFSDLMSGLLVIFILAVIALIIDLTEKTVRITKTEKELRRQTENVKLGIKELKQAELVRKNIIHEIRSELTKRNVLVKIADNETVIRIPESTLTFQSGSDRIPVHSKPALNEIGMVLSQAINRHNRIDYLDTIFIEGHTDSDDIYYRGKGNWGLSVDRAISVWSFWDNQANLTPQFSSITNHHGQSLFSVSGYSSTRRVEKNERTDFDKRRNRRIDIRLTVKKPTVLQLEQVITK